MDNHYCTGCGANATFQCVECGEWRCEAHGAVDIRDLSNDQGRVWCSDSGVSCKRGEWCAKTREINARIQAAGECHCDCSIRHAPHGGELRQVVYTEFESEHYDSSGPRWRCAAHMQTGGAAGWRWREVPEESPVSIPVSIPITFTPEQKTRLNDGHSHVVTASIVGGKAKVMVDDEDEKDTGPRCGVAGCNEPATHYDSYVHIVMCSLHARHVAPEYIQPLSEIASTKSFTCYNCGATKPGVPTWTSPEGKPFCKACCDTSFACMRCGHRYPGKPFAQDLDSDGGVCSDCYRLRPGQASTAPVPKPLCGACGHHFDTDECEKAECRCTSSLHRQGSTGDRGRFIDKTRLNHIAFVYNYCENAPDRGVVEQTVVTMDGDECGGVPKVPHLTTHLVWSSHMKFEWERHLSFRADLLFHRKDRYGVTYDRDVKSPVEPDAFGGVVKAGPEGYGLRCALCGGWMRRVAAKLK